MLRRAAARRHLRQAYGNIAAPRDAIIDVEAVVLDTKGRPDFAVLEASLAADGQKAIAWVFELLFVHERDLRALPSGERREALEALIGRGTDAILLSEQGAPDGDEFFEIARAHGLEGIVSKRVDIAVGPSSEFASPKKSVDANVSPHATDQSSTIAVTAINNSRM